jgi:hypothetical protein
LITGCMDHIKCGIVRLRAVKEDGGYPTKIYPSTRMDYNSTRNRDPPGCA